MNANTKIKSRERFALIRNQREQGFTLVEILAAVVIIGILATLAILKIISVINNSRDTAARDEVSAMRKAQAVHFSLNNVNQYASYTGKSDTTSPLVTNTNVAYSASDAVTNATSTASGTGATADCSIVVTSKTGKVFTGSCNSGSITVS